MNPNIRPSEYLLSRTQALLQALTFFSEGTRNKPLSERHLCFLAQIGFWEWEVDNLIYSFQTFKERKDDWDSSRALEDSLQTAGFLVRGREIGKIRSARNKPKRQQEEVVAPVAQLQEVLDLWNSILDDCEPHIRAEDAANGAKFGAQLHTDLSKFRKSLT